MGVAGVGDCASLPAGLVAEVTVDAAVLGDPCLRHEISGGVGDDGNVAYPAFIRGGENDVTSLETAVGAGI